MSSKLKFFTLLFVGGLSVGYVGAWQFSQQQQTAKFNPAIETTPKLQKMQSSIAVRLKTPEGVSEFSSGTTVLVAEIQSFITHDAQLSYQWDLPASVIIVEGQLSSTLEIKAGETQEVMLQVQGFSQEEFKTVAVSAHLSDSETLIGQSAVITSRPEDSYDLLSSSSSSFATGVRKTASDESESLERKKRPLLTGKIIR